MNQVHFPLNHLYITLPVEVYQKVVSSSFFREEFAPAVERSATNSFGTYSGFYIHSKNHYFEIFAEGAHQHAKPDTSALAFGVDVSGAIKKVHAQLQKCCGEIKMQLAESNGKPWFHYFDLPLPEEEKYFLPWVMEYCSEKMSEDDISRKTYNADMKVMKESKLANPLFESITEIVLQLTSETNAIFKTCLEAFGYEIEGSADAWFARGEENQFVVKIGEHSKITCISCQLNQDLSGRDDIVFGENCYIAFPAVNTLDWHF